MGLGLGLSLTLGQNGVGSGAFAPGELTSKLLGWWTADRVDLMTLSGAQVTSWRDVVAGYDAVQGVSASRPVFDATSFNGMPGMTFDGIDDYVEYAAVPWPRTAGVEIWGVVEQTATNADSGTRRALAFGGTGANTRHSLISNFSSGARRGAMVGGTGAAAPNATNTNVELIGRHVMRGVVTATGVSIQVDRDAITSETAGVPSVGNTATRIGCQVIASPADFWKGQIRDMLITSPLTTQEASNLLTWALARAGI